MSKKYYVVAYVDEAGIERVAPKTLRVSYGDKVIWSNNLGEQYTAQDFQSPTGGSLFPDSSYPMPPNNTSNSAQVQFSQPGSHTFTYNCVNGLGESLDPVIIVDNPGADDDGDGDDRRMKVKSNGQKKKGQKKKKASKSKAAAPRKPKGKKRR